MVHGPRRVLTRWAPWLVTGSLLVGIVAVPTAAQAQSIAQTKAEIASLSAQLSRESQLSEITANKYDADQATLDQLSSNIRVLQGKVVVKRAAANVTSKKMVTAIVRSYVLGASDAQVEALFNQNVTLSDARDLYSSLVIGNLNQLRNRYETQKRSLSDSINQIAVQRAKALAQTDAMRSLLAQNVQAQNETQHTLNVVTASLRTEIINYEIAVGAEAARTRNISAENEAVNAASEVGGQTAANLVLQAIKENTPAVTYGTPAGSAQGEAALHAALSQAGVPYVWGGETPGAGFDCSGLVQWAWGRAGYQIPRTTEEQWAALPHVSLHDLQPGDLLFYYNLDGDNAVDHVVMYAGSGPWGSSTIFAASHTGTLIGYEPIFTFGLIGAARP